MLRFHCISSDKVQKSLLREIRVWASLDHCNILQFIGFVRDESNIIGLVSPWMVNGSVMKYVERNSETDRCTIIKGVLHGVEYLHAQTPPVIHGDIKGANVLISDNGAPLLCDFGLSTFGSEDMTTSSAGHGSWPWMAPERLAPSEFGLTPIESRTLASDIFSFGMTAFEILSGTRPFATMTGWETRNAIVEGRRPDLPNSSSPSTSTARVSIAISQSWDPHPSKRPSARQIIKMLDRTENREVSRSFLGLL